MSAEWWQQFLQQVETRAHAPSLTVGGPGEQRTHTYAELYGAITEQSERLRKLRPGGHGPVGVIAANSFATVTAALGAVHARRAVLLVSRDDPPARVRELFAAAGVVARTGSHPDPELATAEGEWCAVPDARPERPVLPADAAFLFPTSGSTAASKLVVQTHAGTSSNAAGVARHHRVRPGDVIAGGLPIHHVNGWHFTVIGVLAAGAHAVVPPTISPLDHLALVAEHGARIASVVPTVLNALTTVHHHWGPPPGFDYFVSAAAPLQARTARAVWDQFGCRIVQSYGLTETINFSAALPADLTSEQYRAVMLDGEHLPVGVAFPGQELTIRDDAGDELPDGETGEVCMRGPAVMAGYLDNPEQTAAALQAGWFRSGDLGYLADRAGHRMLHLTGRRKNVAKIRGESVSLEEIERLALTVPGVADAGAVSSPDTWEDERITLLLVGAGATAAARERLAQVLPRLHLPQAYVEVDRIPRSPTGKISRRELSRLLEAPDRPPIDGGTS